MGKNWLLTLLMISCLAQAEGRPELKMITIQHRFPQDVLPTVQSMVGEDGSVSAIQNYLMVRASPERMAQIEQVVATLDTATRNLRITVSHQQRSTSQRQAIGASGSIRSGDVQLNLPPSRQAGVQVDIDYQQRQRNSQGSEFISVMEGQRGFIRVGQSVPYTQQWQQFAQQYRVQQRFVAYQDITTGFAVRPRVIGDQVELEITPRIATMSDGGVVDFNELSTVVRVRAGEWVDLGGVMQTRDDVSRAIFSQASQTGATASNLQIRVD